MSKLSSFKKRKLETSNDFSDYTNIENPDDFEKMMQNEFLCKIRRYVTVITITSSGNVFKSFVGMCSKKRLI